MILASYGERAQRSVNDRAVSFCRALDSNYERFILKLMRVTPRWLLPFMFVLAGCLPPRGLSYSEFGDETFDEKLDFVNLKQASDLLRSGKSNSKIELKLNECYDGRTIALAQDRLANLLEQKSCSDLSLDTYINTFFVLPENEVLEVICADLYPEKGIDQLAEEISYVDNIPTCPNNISGRKVGSRYRKHSAEFLSSDWIFLHPSVLEGTQG